MKQKINDSNLKNVAGGLDTKLFFNKKNENLFTSKNDKKNLIENKPEDDIKNKN